MPELVRKEELFDVSNWNFYNKVININELRISLIEASKLPDTSSEIEELKKLSSVGSIYRHISENDIIDTEKFLNMLYENITYSSTSNYFIDNIVDIQGVNFNSIISSINLQFNNSYVTEDEKIYLNDKGYNLLNIIQLRKNDEIVVPVCLDDDDSFKALFIYKFTDVKDTSAYRICSVVINKKTGDICFLCNSRLSSKASEGDQKIFINSADSFYYQIKAFLAKRGISFAIRDPKNEKKKMFEFCNHLNKVMIDEFENELSRKIEDTCIRQINEITSLVSTQINFDSVSKKKIFNKIFSTYLGECMTKTFDASDLVFIAKERKLPGYPTLINFVSSTTSKGQTKTRDKESPLTFEEVYYSLSTDFSENEELEEWRLSWFDSNFFDNARDEDVSQTSIKITRKFFKIINLNTNRRRKRMVDYIIEEIRRSL